MSGVRVAGAGDENLSAVPVSHLSESRVRDQLSIGGEGGEEMRGRSRFDWEMIRASVLGLALVCLGLGWAIFIFTTRDAPVVVEPDRDLTEVISHAIRMENDLVDLERRVGRLEVREATGEEGTR